MGFPTDSGVLTEGRIRYCRIKFIRIHHVFCDLSPFFHRPSRLGEGGSAGETEKQQLRDAKAYIKGKRDGKIVIENIKPKVTGGKHKVIDERFTDSAQFKETEEGEIRE
jgi:hypothetical protein